MNKYALIQNNVVINLIVIEPEKQDFLAALQRDGIIVVEDVDNTAFIDGTYDPETKKFYPPKPYPSWVCKEELNGWYAPKEMPLEPGTWEWDESMLDYKNLTPVTTGPRIIED